MIPAAAFLCSAGAATAIVAARARHFSAHLLPPVAKRVPHVVRFGDVPGEMRGTDPAKLMRPPVTHVDPLFWLRHDDRKTIATEAPEVLAHLEAENAYTQSKTAHLKAPGGPVDRLYAEFLSRIKETDSDVPYKHGPFVYYTRTVQGQSYPIHCRRPILDAAASVGADGSAAAAAPAAPASLGEEEVLLDENALAAGSRMCDVHAVEVSPDHALLAHSVDYSGEEEYTVRFSRTAADASGASGGGGAIADELLRTSGDVEWGADGTTVYYLTLDAQHRPFRLWRHVLGTPQAADACVFEERDDRFWLDCSRSLSGDYLLVSAASKVTSEVWALALTPRAHAAAARAGAAPVTPIAVVDAEGEEDEEAGEEAEAEGSGDDAGSGSDEEAKEEQEAAARPPPTAAELAAAAAVPLPPLWPIALRREGVLYEADHVRRPGDGADDAFLLLTNADGAKNFKLAVVRAAGAPQQRQHPQQQPWVDVLPASPARFLTGVEAFAGFWGLHGREGGYANAWVLQGADVDAALAAALPLGSAAAPEAAAAAAAVSLAPALQRVPPRDAVFVLGGGANAEYETDRWRFSYSSPTQPTLACEYRPGHVATTERAAGAGAGAAPAWPAGPIVPNEALAHAAAPAFAAHTGGASIAVLKQRPCPGADLSRYAAARTYATAADGTRVPISIVYSPAVHSRAAAAAAAAGSGCSDGGTESAAGCPLPAPAPLLLYGYGSYGAAMDPTFSAQALSLCDRGVVYAIAHVRGGDEMGRAWYEDEGKLLKKWNTFNDFIACADHLVAAGWTAKGRIAAHGGSAGGLLMGVVMNERPDLWGAVLSEVGFVDVLTTMSDSSIPLTTTEWEEWGNPNEREAYEYMRTYSPLDNVRRQAYPPRVLLDCSLHDTRVAYWEVAKFAQRLRDVNTAGDAGCVLFKCELDEGHAGAMDRYAYYREKAFNYAWVCEALGVPV